MNLYFISGLGADRRAFQRLSLPDRFVIHHLDWIKPMENENLDAYARRLSDCIDPSQPFALVGLSFGGMIASAMTQFVRPVKTILNSSIGCFKELPWYFRLAGASQVHRLIPLSLLRNPTQIAYWLFGAKSATEKRLLEQIIIDNDPRFIKWALGAILSWKAKVRPEGLVHIHGSKDKILPVRYTRPTIEIQNGSHFMVWTRAGEISKALINILS